LPLYRAWAEAGAPLLPGGNAIPTIPGRASGHARYSGLAAGVPGELNLVLESVHAHISVRLSATSQGQKRRAAQLLRHHLEAVADAERRDAEFEHAKRQVLGD
jgi:hypothetical protein